MERFDSMGKWLIENSTELLVEPSQEWVLENQPLIPEKTLDEVKQEKIAELNQKCSESILGKFESSALGEPHLYSCDDESQKNFLFIKSLLDTYPDDATIGLRISDTREVLEHNKTEFLQVFQDSGLHILSNVTKFRTLETQVLACETAEDVNLIIW